MTTTDQYRKEWIDAEDIHEESYWAKMLIGDLDAKLAAEAPDAKFGRKARALLAKYDAEKIPHNLCAAERAFRFIKDLRDLLDGKPAERPVGEG